MFNKNSKKISIVINTSKSTLSKVTPKKFSDSKAVAKEILKGNVIVIDLVEMEKVEAIRFVDFITGVLFTTGGAFKKIGTKSYLLAPSKELLNKFETQLV